jgi:hypothetical protein
VLLLITGSVDGTSDRIVLSYGDDVFRLNYDLWRDYEISFTQDGWRIRNPANGLAITSETISRAFWWKPFAYPSPEDPLIQEEIKYTFRDIYGWCADRGVARGNHFTYHHVLGKMTILGKAKIYFAVPDTLVTVGLSGIRDFHGEPIVVKSLSSARTGDSNIMVTTEVEADRLDPSFPWCVQQKIESDWDVTVFYCDRRCFAFKRSRADLNGLDWRVAQSVDPSRKDWIPIDLGAGVAEKIVSLSDDIDVEFGRYDFLLDKRTGALTFLELNAHGQWVFLDYFDEYGLMDCFLNWIKR